jgi:hypothetical protein
MRRGLESEDDGGGGSRRKSAVAARTKGPGLRCVCVCGFIAVLAAVVAVVSSFLLLRRTCSVVAWDMGATGS